jgi:hypothetical protein
MPVRPSGPAVSAFTLIEVMASLALGAVLIVTITQTFRALSRVVATVNLQGRENEMLRTGLLAAIEDADFYHSDANPDFPYRKGWTRAPLTAANTADKRHFAQVVFDARTGPADPYAARAAGLPGRLRLLDGTQPESAIGVGVVEDGILGNPGILPNPNVLLPSDPRSWVRVTTVNNSRFPWRPPGFASGYGFQSPQSARANRYRIGTARTDQIYGPVQLMASTDMSQLAIDTRVGPGQAVDPWVNQTMPTLQASLWQRLGYLGTWAYTRPGAPINCLDADGFLPRWYSPEIGRGQRISSPLPPFYPAVASAMPGSVPVPGADGNLHLSEYFAVGLPQEHVLHMLHRWGPHSSWEAQLGVFQSATGKTSAMGMKPVFQEDVSTITNIYSNTIGGFNRYLWVMNYQPWNSGSWNFDGQRTNIADLARNPSLTSTTWRFPSNRSDIERGRDVAERLDLSGRPEGYPVMSTSVIRLHCLFGDQATFCRVQVRVPETGRLLELPFSLMTASYRGARQHWAGVVSATTPTPAGDRYAVPQP